MLAHDGDPPQTVLDLLALLFTIAFQSYLTIGLHCAELIVNASRDEGAWRGASRLHGKGAQLTSNAIETACTSWKTIVLSTLKASVHWIFGRGLRGGGTAGIIEFWVGPLWILSAFTFLLAVFGTCLALQKPHGPQPATYGHLRSLAELIDDWAKEGKNLYWGDKGPGTQPGTRVAGTSGDTAKLGPINHECLDQFSRGSSIASTEAPELYDSGETSEAAQAPDPENARVETLPLMDIQVPSSSLRQYSPAGQNS